MTTLAYMWRNKTRCDVPPLNTPLDFTDQLTTNQAHVKLLEFKLCIQVEKSRENIVILIC